MKVAIEAEQSVLGCLLFEPSCLALVRSVLPGPEFFMRREHSEVYRAVLDLYDEGEPVDVVTIVERLEARKSLNGDHTLDRLESLLRETATAANAAAYAKLVRREHHRRSLAVMLGEAQEALLTSDPSTIAGELQTKLDRSPGAEQRTKTVLDLIGAGFDAVKRSQEGRHLIPTGLEQIDRYTGGFEPGRLYVVAARPGCGKSALLLASLHHMANNGYGVGFCSLEMPLRELAIRIFASRYGLNVTRLIRGYEGIADDLDDRYQLNSMSHLPLYFDDESTNLTGIVARAAEWKHQFNIAALFVDYLGLVEVDGNEPRHVKLGQVSRTLKQMAKRLEIPIIAACQLNREVVKEERRPWLSDLRDSGSIEQDADVVIALNPIAAQDSDGRTLIEVGVLKNRSGETGWGGGSVTFEGKTQRFVTDSPARQSA